MTWYLLTLSNLWRKEEEMNKSIINAGILTFAFSFNSVPQNVTKPVFVLDQESAIQHLGDAAPCVAERAPLPVFSKKIVEGSEVKSRYVARLNDLAALPDNWDGNGAHRIIPSVVEVIREVIEKTPASLLSFWRIFPDLNGTLLLTAKGKHITTLSIGVDEFSFIARCQNGNMDCGKRSTSSTGIIDVMALCKSSVV